MIPAISPQRVSLMEKIASSLATTTSQAATKPVPPPKQPPCTSASVGTGKVSSRRTVSPVARETRSFSAGEVFATSLIHLRSTPAWKCLPLPRSTTSRRSGLAPSASRAACTPPIRSPLYALFTSGRFRLTVATPRESSSQNTVPLPTAFAITVFLSALARRERGWILRGSGMVLQQSQRLPRDPARQERVALVELDAEGFRQGGECPRDARGAAAPPSRGAGDD